jgi:hypothetical protein
VRTRRRELRSLTYATTACRVGSYRTSASGGPDSHSASNRRVRSERRQSPHPTDVDSGISVPPHVRPLGCEFIADLSPVPRFGDRECVTPRRDPDAATAPGRNDVTTHHRSHRRTKRPTLTGTDTTRSPLGPQCRYLIDRPDRSTQRPSRRSAANEPIRPRRQSMISSSASVSRRMTGSFWPPSAQAVRPSMASPDVALRPLTSQNPVARRSVHELPAHGSRRCVNLKVLTKAWGSAMPRTTLGPRTRGRIRAAHHSRRLANDARKAG